MTFSIVFMWDFKMSRMYESRHSCFDINSVSSNSQQYFIQQIISFLGYIEQTKKRPTIFLFGLTRGLLVPFIL